MDDIDRKILNLIQKEFPVCAEPYKVIGDKLSLGEKEVIERIRRLKADGIIRRIGAVFDLGKLGFVSTLCAARVPEGGIPDFVAIVNSYSGVTHNYRRNHDYNIWFTFIAESVEALERSLGEIRTKTGVRDIISMPAGRTFKINATFEL
ncbi:MAG TPA: AsnC family transcriptional regulator [Syntrophales bacterium]|nr:AsnC family transcriptional regulator [Syntrophales bacterium]HOX95626.1 AsnC family transcriptional regulator [Syntrophales bacterium]HPI56677.1 AsnC family transcriptional regulator [Syntrophales bacterium]HPN24897.1 AsnC family transcriptional regulator [Syntrophales bacterium]HQM29706.1 AsnC family transcriptional regulator [Syntrophales bacterium]